MPLVFQSITDQKGNVRISRNGGICTLVKLRLYLYNLEHTAAFLCGGSRMENVKESENAKQQHRSIANEEENFDTFIKAMVQIVEKYGRFVLQELALSQGMNHSTLLARWVNDFRTAGPDP